MFRGKREKKHRAIDLYSRSSRIVKFTLHANVLCVSIRKPSIIDYSFTELNLVTRSFVSTIVIAPTSNNPYGFIARVAKVVYIDYETEISREPQIDLYTVVWYKILARTSYVVYIYT